MRVVVVVMVMSLKRATSSRSRSQERRRRRREPRRGRGRRRRARRSRRCCRHLRRHHRGSRIAERINGESGRRCRRRRSVQIVWREGVAARRHRRRAPGDVLLLLLLLLVLLLLLLLSPQAELGGREPLGALGACLELGRAELCLREAGRGEGEGARSRAVDDRSAGAGVCAGTSSGGGHGCYGGQRGCRGRRLGGDRARRQGRHGCTGTKAQAGQLSDQGLVGRAGAGRAAARFGDGRLRAAQKHLCRSLLAYAVGHLAGIYPNAQVGGQVLPDVPQIDAALPGSDLEHRVQGRGRLDAAERRAPIRLLRIPVSPELSPERPVQFLGELVDSPAGQLVVQEGDEEVESHLDLNLHPAGTRACLRGVGHGMHPKNEVRDRRLV